MVLPAKGGCEAGVIEWYFLYCRLQAAGNVDILIPSDSESPLKKG